MMVLYSPQINPNNTLTYQFSGDKITATLNGIEDVFDFSGVPQGQVNGIVSTLAINPVLNAYRDSNNILHVELLNFISYDATESERFPVEVSV